MGLHCLVVGRVQGVFFRAATQRKAQELSITGWVRNLPDGRVEVSAFGSTEQLNALEEWLWSGPAAAKVTAVESSKIPLETFASFTIR